MMMMERETDRRDFVWVFNTRETEFDRKPLRAQRTRVPTTYPHVVHVHASGVRTYLGCELKYETTVVEF